MRPQAGAGPYHSGGRGVAAAGTGTVATGSQGYAALTRLAVDRVQHRQTVRSEGERAHEGVHHKQTIRGSSMEAARGSSTATHDAAAAYAAAAAYTRPATATASTVRPASAMAERPGSAFAAVAAVTRPASATSAAASAAVVSVARRVDTRRHLGYESRSLMAELDAERRAEADTYLAAAIFKAAAGRPLSGRDKITLRTGMEAVERKRASGQSSSGGDDVPLDSKDGSRGSLADRGQLGARHPIRGVGGGGSGASPAQPGNDLTSADIDNARQEGGILQVDEDFSAIVTKAAEGRHLTEIERARLKAKMIEVERRRRKAAEGDGRGGGGRPSSNAAAGPAAWRFDRAVGDHVKDVRARPDTARRRRYKSACRDVQWICERRKVAKQRLRQVFEADNREAKLLVMWFQSRKIQRAWKAFKWRANTRASAEAQKHALALNPIGSRTKLDRTPIGPRVILSNEMSSVAHAFQAFSTYQATGGSAFLEKLERSRSRVMQPKPDMTGKTRSGKLQLEKNEIPQWTYRS